MGFVCFLGFESKTCKVQMQTGVGEVGLLVRLEVVVRSDLVLSCFGLHLPMLT